MIGVDDVVAGNIDNRFSRKEITTRLFIRRAISWNALYNI